jgi:hypothetical protein
MQINVSIHNSKKGHSIRNYLGPCDISVAFSSENSSKYNIIEKFTGIKFLHGLVRIMFLIFSAVSQNMSLIIF